MKMTSFSSLPHGEGRGGRHEEARHSRDREAEDALRILGFWDAERVVQQQGHERVLAALAYVKSRRNLRGVGAYVRRLLREGSIPAPLVWEARPSPGEPLSWNDWRSLDGHQAEEAEEAWSEDPCPQAAGVWARCLAELELQVTRPNFDTWFRPTVGLVLRDGELVIGAANAFTVDYLRGKMKPLISRTVSGVVEAVTEVRIVLFEGGSHGDETDRGGGDDGVHRECEPRQEPAGSGDR